MKLAHDAAGKPARTLVGDVEERAGLADARPRLNPSPADNAADWRDDLRQGLNLARLA